MFAIAKNGCKAGYWQIIIMTAMFFKLGFIDLILYESDREVRTMTPLQNIWVTFFILAPAIYLGIEKSWLTGVLAFILIILISWGLGYGVNRYGSLSLNTMAVWAWCKPPFVALLVLVTL
jgi:hypothetical protein